MMHGQQSVKNYMLWLNTLWKGENVICFETQHCQWVSRAVSRHTCSWSHKIREYNTAFISGALAKLWQATICFVMSVRTSVCRSAWYNWTHIGQIFVKFDVRVFSKKSVVKSQVSLKSDKNNRYFIWRFMYIYDNTSLNYS